MKKMIKLLSIGVLTSITSLQAIACTDDSKYKTFLSDVDSSKSQDTAFFGVLGGSATTGSSTGAGGDAKTQALVDAFDVFQQTQPGNTESDFAIWKDNNSKEIENAGIKDVQLKAYQGTKDDADATSFWNDKKISWQKNIFNWILDKKDDKSCKGIGNGNSQVNTLETNKKDSDKKTMFADVPIVFCVVKGQLYTVGQNWFDPKDPKINPTSQINAIKQFIISNIFNRAKPKTN